MQSLDAKPSFGSAAHFSEREQRRGPERVKPCQGVLPFAPQGFLYGRSFKGSSHQPPQANSSLSDDVFLQKVLKAAQH